MPRHVVLVSGPPGAGKSTIAAPLAAALDFPLLAKDTIKEAIHEGLGLAAIDLAESRRIGRATFEVMWALAKQMPVVVLECNFRREQRDDLLALHPAPVEVYCSCPPDVASRRYRDRHAAGARHQTHVLDDVPAETMARFVPLALGPVIEVDTTSPVDIDSLARRVRDLLPPAASARSEG